MPSINLDKFPGPCDLETCKLTFLCGLAALRIRPVSSFVVSTLLHASQLSYNPALDMSVGPMTALPTRRTAMTDLWLGN